MAHGAQPGRHEEPGSADLVRGSGRHRLLLLHALRDGRGAAAGAGQQPGARRVGRHVRQVGRGPGILRPQVQEHPGQGIQSHMNLDKCKVHLHSDNIRDRDMII